MTTHKQAEISIDTGLFFAGAAAAAAILWPSIGQLPHAIAEYGAAHCRSGSMPPIAVGWFIFLFIPALVGCLIGPAFFRFVATMEEEQ
jgi:hypothetical protein